MTANRKTKSRSSDVFQPTTSRPSFCLCCMWTWTCVWQSSSSAFVGWCVPGIQFSHQLQSFRITSIFKKQTKLKLNNNWKQIDQCIPAVNSAWQESIMLAWVESLMIFCSFTNFPQMSEQKLHKTLNCFIRTTPKMRWRRNIKMVICFWIIALTNNFWHFTFVLFALQ